MHAVNRIGRVAVKQAFFDHFAPAAFVFFGGLKDEIDRAGEIGIFGEDFGRTEQHGHMTIMAAGMHFARMFRGIGQIGGFVDIKRIHVGAKADAFA